MIIIILVTHILIRINNSSNNNNNKNNNNNNKTQQQSYISCLPGDRGVKAITKVDDDENDDNEMFVFETTYTIQFINSNIFLI